MFFHNKPLILAHRALYPGYPENTLLSLQKAFENGAEYAEVDVEFTRDGRMVSSHDSTVDRCTNGTGLISDLDFEYIRSLDASHYIQDKMLFPTLSLIQIPTLEEIFQLIKPTTMMLELHIKTLEALDIDEHPDENVPELLLKYHLEKRCNINIDILAPADYLYEFSKYKNLKFSQNAYIDPELPKTQGPKKLKIILDALQESRFFGLDLKPQFIDKEVTRMVHDYNLELQCYPTNDEDMMRRLIENECDVIQTDRMDLLKSVRAEYGY